MMTNKKLLEWRKNMKWTQRYAAKQLDVALVTYQQWEQSNIENIEILQPFSHWTEQTCVEYAVATGSKTDQKSRAVPVEN